MPAQESNRRRGKRSLASALLSVSVLAACTEWRSQADQPPASSTAIEPSASSAVSGSAPVTQGNTEESDLNGMVGLLPRVIEVTNLAHRATEKLTNECLAPMGFSYELPEGRERPEMPPFAPWRPVSVDDTAEQFDATESTWVPSTTTVEYSDALYGEQIEEWNVADDQELVSGQTTGGYIFDGCLPAAETEVIGGGDPKAIYRLEEMELMLEQLPSTTFTMMLTESPFQEKAQAWTACMDDRGYATSGVFQPDFGSLNGLPNTPRQADDYNACLADTNITAVGDAQYSKTQKALVDEMYGSVEQWKAELDAIEKRATDALSN